MVQTPLRLITLETFLQLPDTKPASEFINDRIIQKPMPQAKHSAIQGDLVPAINQALRTNRIARAFPELRCTFGNKSIVPNVVVLTWNNIQRDDHGKLINQVRIAPDWTIEILSPDQSQSKVVLNILHCLDHGTQMGWLIDPEEELIFVYHHDRTIAVFNQPQDRVPVPEFANSLHLTIEQIFNWLQD